MNSNKALVVFQGKQIRRTWHNDGWYFSVVDVVAALTDSVDAKDYWYRLKKRELDSSGIELSTICLQLKLISPDGKKYSTDCANTESMFRIIQSIPSKKAEPLFPKNPTTMAAKASAEEKSVTKFGFFLCE